MEINVCNENDSLPFQNDSVYHDIGECTEMMQTAGCGNISRTIERPTLASRPRNFSYAQSVHWNTVCRLKKSYLAVTGLRQ